MTTEAVTSASRSALTSLSEVHRSIRIPRHANGWRRFLAYIGPGYLVSVGYMDPGNWGTDIAGGAKYGYALLWVILVSNLMAILLQTLSARLGLVTGKDLAQACRDYYKKPAAIALWFLCEVAIIACDLAEVIGSAVALNLLGGKYAGMDGQWHDRIPILWGVLFTSLDVLALLGLMRFGFRKIEAIVITLVGTIAACFALQVFLAKPDWAAAAHGLLFPSMPDKGALFIALGILGATVMPHNLYLHSSIVQTRNHQEDETAEPSAASRKSALDRLREAVRNSTWDTVIALTMAFFVNAAILVVAAGTFHATGHFDVAELGDAHQLLRPLLGGAAATAFAVALLASGQSSTITGTLAGQIVMEGFLNIRIAPWLRRLITRLLAIVPAIILIMIKGDKDTVGLLVLSQVVLSMQLSFAIFPLMMFTSDKKKMGVFANPLWLKIAGYMVCVTIALLNMKLLLDSIGPWWFGACVAVVVGFLAWVTFVYKEKVDQHHGVTT